MLEKVSTKMDKLKKKENERKSISREQIVYRARELSPLAD